MVTDYEAAWIAFLELIASKPQHSRSDLLVQAADLVAEHRVPAGELSRLLRLHGVEVERVRAAATDPEGVVPFVGGAPSPADASSPATTIPDGGHDGEQHRSTADAERAGGGGFDSGHPAGVVG